MIRVVFKNLEKSELAREAVMERLEILKEKFPDLARSQMRATLERLNSSRQPGPDLFSVTLQVIGGRYGGIRMEKSEPNLYAALANLAEHMLERLNRYGDRDRVRRRGQARKLARLETFSGAS